MLEVGGLSFGVLTCYDLRFPESARRLVDAGAQVIVVPAAWADGELKAMHWRALAVARAIENTSTVIGVGQAGRGVVGRSLVVGPDGVVGLEFDEQPNIRTVDIDGDALLEVRLRNPSLANRRYTVVPVSWGPRPRRVRRHRHGDVVAPEPDDRQRVEHLVEPEPARARVGPLGAVDDRADV